jgi:hypothetical protein
MSNYPAPGIYDGMPADQYFSIECASNSGLKHIARSPLHFITILRTPVEPTPAMIIGSATHTAVLEPHLFDAQYVVLPDERPKRPSSVQLNAKKPSTETLYAIDWWKSFNAANAGRQVLDAADHDQVRRMADAVRAHPVAADILSAGKAEQSVFWLDEETGVQCKARVDWLRGAYPADLKTTDSAAPDDFVRSVVRYRYMCQSAMYLDGLAAVGERVDDFPFIVVEKQPPYAVAVYMLDDAAIAEGRRLYRRDLATYAWASATDSWPGYPAEIRELSLPRWAMNGDGDE